MVAAVLRGPVQCGGGQLSSLFFFNDTATTEIYTLSLHDALPIWCAARCGRAGPPAWSTGRRTSAARSEEHTSELQSRQYLVCRLLLEKKKQLCPSKRPWRSKQRRSSPAGAPPAPERQEAHQTDLQ